MICPRCGNDHPPSHFYRPGRQCKDCARAYSRQRAAMRAQGVPASMAMRLFELADPFNRGMMR